MSHYYAGLDTKDKLVTDMTSAGVDTSIFPAEKGYVQAAPEHHVDADAYECFYIDLVDVSGTDRVVQYFEKVADNTIWKAYDYDSRTLESVSDSKADVSAVSPNHPNFPTLSA
jgi:hypothetical protein